MNLDSDKCEDESWAASSFPRMYCVIPVIPHFIYYGSLPLYTRFFYFLFGLGPSNEVEISFILVEIINFC